jgi:RNA polymerase sigma-70 factor (ECF subfamily)
MQNYDLDKVIEQYRTMIFRIAYGYVKNVHDADDITQDVFLKLFKSEKQFVSEENRKAWLIRVAVNQAKTMLTSVWRTRITNLDNLNEAEVARGNLSDDGLELYEYVKDLKPKYRTIIYLYYYERYSVKEIAAILKIRETTVTTQLSRARNQLKEILLAEGYT